MKTDFEKVVAFLKRDFDHTSTLEVLTGDAAMWYSWGPSRVSVLKGYGRNDEQVVVDSESMNRGVIFHVQGRLHTGWVLVTLDWVDVYEVNLFTEEMEHRVGFPDIYVDMLRDTIDELVEG